jgi:pimeloyl-ACP methyl ester carboxylesterase
MTTKPIYKTPAGEQAVLSLYESILDRWLVPHERLTISTRHGDTFVIASGDPSMPPLVLLHGAGTNSAVWAGDVPEYSQHYRVYAVDLIGEAGKSAPKRPDWNSPAYADWLDDVLHELEVDRVTFVGISQGSWTALKFAVAQPQRVEKLVLICPGGIIPDRLSFMLSALASSLMGRRGIRRMVRLIYADQPVPDGVEEITALMMSHFRSRVGVLPIFSDEELKRLTMPVLLLGGAKDALRDIPKIAARMESLLPDLAVRIIPGAGHAVLNTTPYIVPFLLNENEQPITLSPQPA